MRNVSLILAAAIVGCQSTPRGIPEDIGWNPKYRILTLDALRAEPDLSIETAVTHNIAWRINGDYEREEAILAALSPGQQMVHATWLVEAEVNNGGFNQFFYNSSGAFADEALAGFRLLELSEYEALLERAIAIAATLQDVHSEAKEAGTAEAFSDTYDNNPLEPLDKEFFSLSGLSEARIKYIRQNLSEFTGP